MKYAVDRIEEGKVFLENLETRELVVIDKSELNDISEGDILTLNNGVFLKDSEYTEERRAFIRAKMDRLKRRKEDI